MALKYPTNKIEIRVLEPHEWHLVEKDYVRQFENVMPNNPQQSVFFGVFENDKLIGFAHLEQVFHLNAVYMMDKHQTTTILHSLFATIENTMPRGIPFLRCLLRNSANC